MPEREITVYVHSDVYYLINVDDKTVRYHGSFDMIMLSALLKDALRMRAKLVIHIGTTSIDPALVCQLVHEAKRFPLTLFVTP